MRIRLVTSAFTATTLAATLTLNAQTGNPQTPNPQTQDRRTATDTQARGTAADQSITVTGCLQAEKDVPGRSQSVTERAGIGEDYVLTNVKMAQGAPTSAMGLATMYQIKGGSVRESELKNHLGHQVEVVGRIENASESRDRTGSAATTAAGDRNLPNFEATSLKMLSTTCQPQQ